MDHGRSPDRGAALQVVLAEYQFLRSLMNEKFRFHYQLFSTFTAALLVFVGLVVKAEALDLLHLLTPFSVVFFLRMLWEQHTIRRISAYLKDSEQRKIRYLVGDLPRIDGHDLPLGWQHYYESQPRPYLLFKWAFWMLFVGLPVGIAFVYSMMALRSVAGSGAWLPTVLEALCGAVHLAAGVAMTYGIVKM